MGCSTERTLARSLWCAGSRSLGGSILCHSELWCMVYSEWCMVHGVWCMMHGAWCLVPDASPGSPAVCPRSQQLMAAPRSLCARPLPWCTGHCAPWHDALVHHGAQYVVADAVYGVVAPCPGARHHCPPRTVAAEPCTIYSTMYISLLCSITSTLLYINYIL